MGRGGAGSFVGYRFAADLRRRRVAWLGVAVIIGVSAGLVMALAAGARRSDTAIDRFIAGANAHEDLVISGIPGTFDFAEVDLDEVAALPGVADSQRGDVLAATGRTEEGVLIDTSVVNFLADPSGRIGRSFDRFKILDGRLADPDELHEVVATFRTAEAFDLDVGSTIEVNMMDGEELGQLFAGEATFESLSTVGPLDRFTVVGVVVEAGSLAPPAPDDTSTMWMTPAADRAFGPPVVETMLVQLEDGAAGEPEFLDRLEQLGGDLPVNVLPVAADAEDADRGVSPIVRALGLTALLLGVVTVFLAGQVLSRQAAAESDDTPVLRTLGWTRRDLLRLRVGKAVVIGTASAIVAVVVGVALSPLFPLGLARKVEPDPGVGVDGVVVLAGAIAVLAAVAGLAALSGWLELRRDAAPRVRRPSRVVGALSSAGAPPPATVGASLALQGGPAGAPPPVVSAGGGVVIGIGTVAAVLAFMASLGHLTETPTLYGWNWDVELGQEFSEALTVEDVEFLASDPDVESLAVGTTAAVTVGDERVHAYAVDDVAGSVRPTLLDGRRAEASGEIAVAPDLGEVGEELTVRVGGEQARYEVVGHVALPRADAMLTFAGLQRASPDVSKQTALVDLRDGADVEAFTDRITPTLGYTGQDVATPDLPDDLVNFGRVDSAPAAVAVAMSLVAVATLVHAMVTTVRRRNRDLAVLRALGLTRRQVQATVAWQSGLLVAVPILVAVPVGVAAGRWGWLIFADELKVVAEPIVPVVALLLAAATAVALAELVAVITGRWSATQSASLALRAE